MHSATLPVISGLAFAVLALLALGFSGVLLGALTVAIGIGFTIYVADCLPGPPV